MQKKHFFKIITLLAVYLNTTSTHAQEFEQGKGKAMIYFESNTNVIVRLDTTLIKQTTQLISLKEGKYIVRAWAPTKQLFVDTISIHENKTTIVSAHLKNTLEYSKYKKDLSNYKLKKIGYRFIPLPLTLGYSLFMLNKYDQNKKLMKAQLENATTAAANYANSSSTQDITKYTNDYYSAKADYEKYRIRNNQIAISATVCSSAAFVPS